MPYILEALRFVVYGVIIVLELFVIKRMTILSDFRTIDPLPLFEQKRNFRGR
jgi:hypothetical protein